MISTSPTRGEVLMRIGYECAEHGCQLPELAVVSQPTEMAPTWLVYVRMSAVDRHRAAAFRDSLVRALPNDWVVEVVA